MKCSRCSKKVTLIWSWSYDEDLCDECYRKAAYKLLVGKKYFTEEGFNLWFENAKKGLLGSKAYTGIEYNKEKEMWDVIKEP